MKKCKSDIIEDYIIELYSEGRITLGKMCDMLDKRDRNKKILKIIAFLPIIGFFFIVFSKKYEELYDNPNKLFYLTIYQCFVVVCTFLILIFSI